VRVALDIDGCVYPFEKAARELLAIHRGVTLGQSEGWDWIEDNCSPDDWMWLWNEGVGAGLFTRVAPYAGAYPAVKQLDRLGTLSYITNRPRALRDDTWDWLARYDFPLRDLHVIGVGRPKWAIEPQADIYIDDSPHVIADLILNTDAEVVCFAQPWNTEIVSTPKRLHRLNGWQEVLDFARGMQLATVR
jgi:uncharacterized HAD superfamily protein